MTQWGILEDDEVESRISEYVSDILCVLNQDIESEGLKDTPRRVARYYMEFLNYDSGNTDTTFESIQTDQMVILKDVPFYSLCQHHLLPFQGKISVGYLTGTRVIGLSKIARIIEKHSHKLQIQEKLAHDIANELEEILPDCQGVIVSIEAQHSCMAMRGVRKQGRMVTNVLRGSFKENEVKQEFFMMIKR